MVAIDHGEDFFDALEKFCAQYEIRAGHIPTLLGGFSSIRLVGCSEPLEHPERPLWEEVEITYPLEVFGSGTLAWNQETDQLAPHIHVSAGIKEHSADGRTSHLLGGTVQFINELVVEEIATPDITRLANPELYGVPLLTFGDPAEGY
ncbi:PPC domain-containing DNA-binding protein [Streptomyces sp. NPDC004237]|uniref:PPC domain-containing DNA-binding protein n=1 Tax=Streptomyces sp. NPDC004237 TaxID=3154455 RepID=UPI0033A28747